MQVATTNQPSNTRLSELILILGCYILAATRFIIGTNYCAVQATSTSITRCVVGYRPWK